MYKNCDSNYIGYRLEEHRNYVDSVINRKFTRSEKKPHRQKFINQL